jgi:hypothetical protein
MHPQSIVANPFALMMDPQAVLAAVERSQPLSGLQRRVCRPLDKPLIPRADAANDADISDGADDVEAVDSDFGSLTT